MHHTAAANPPATLLPGFFSIMSSHPTLNANALAELAATIKSWGRELGFQQVGITDVDLAEDERHLQRWLDAGYHGEMGFMAKHGTKRTRPAELVPDTLRVISVRLDYLPADTESAKVLGQPQTAYVSRYAVGRDYHKLMRKRLATLARWVEERVGPFGYRAFVDSAPVMERALARKAGLGWIGKDAMMLNPRAGSLFFRGELYVHLPLPLAAPSAAGHGGSCGACRTARRAGARVADQGAGARARRAYLHGELGLEALCGPGLGRGHDPGVVDQDVHGADAVGDLCGRVGDRVQVGQVQGHGLGVGAGGDAADLVERGGRPFGVPACEQDPGAG